jgi:hypothetical protein
MAAAKKDTSKTGVFIMRLSAAERRDLDRLAKLRKMSASDLVRSLIRNETYHPLTWVERPCAKAGCKRVHNYRADVLPPYFCGLHQQPPAKVLPLRKVK